MESSHSFNVDGLLGVQEVRNERALFVYNRVQNKLTGSIRFFYWLNSEDVYACFRTRFQSGRFPFGH